MLLACPRPGLRTIFAAGAALLLSVMVARSQPVAAPSAVGVAVDSPLEVEAIAEQRIVETSRDGGKAIRFVPASQVRLGEQVHYTLRVRNPGTTPVEQAVVIRTLPHNTRYIAQSATGPGADIHFSIDGGASFAPANDLRITTYVGPPRRATADDYTHIRWRLRHPLAPGATALLRFRAEFR
jgi:uncharacterized repeat protein (TIGR01451 family)